MVETEPPATLGEPLPSVYVDTSVLSYYAEARTTEQARLWREFSRRLLDGQASRFRFCLSDLVIAELADGDWQGKDEALPAAARYPRLAVNERVIATAVFYREQFLAPTRPSTDSLHLALASVHHVDVLVTWNFRHLANPNKRAHLRVLNVRLGLPVPEVVSPLDLLEVEP